MFFLDIVMGGGKIIVDSGNNLLVFEKVYIVSRTFLRFTCAILYLEFRRLKYHLMWIVLPVQVVEMHFAVLRIDVICNNILRTYTFG